MLIIYQVLQTDNIIPASLRSNPGKTSTFDQNDSNAFLNSLINSAVSHFSIVRRNDHRCVTMELRIKASS